MNSIKKQARIAGLWYLLLGISAAIGLMIPSEIMVPGDATATADHVRASETLLRMGIGSELFYQIIAIFLVLALYRLFKAVSEKHAVLMVILGALVSAPIVFVNILNEIAALEVQRSVRSDRWFSLLRIAPAGWAALDLEMEVLASAIRAHLRRTDAVLRVRDREIGVVLIEAVGDGVHAPVSRLREALARHLPEMEVRIGWASVGPGQRQTWQEAWRWAGQLLVADAAVPAAA